MNDFELSSVPDEVISTYLDFPQRNEFLPVGLSGNILQVLVLSSEASHLADYLTWKLGLSVKTIPVDQETFFPVLEHALSLWEDEGDSHSDQDRQADVDLAGQDLLGWSHEDAPIVRLVNKALHQAISQGASDIHFENQDRSLVIRYRMDGELRTARRLDQAIQSTVLARIKVMGHMDVAETRIPQDGRFQVRIGNRNIDLRVSTMPTLNGEKAVLRVLDRTKNILSLPELGLNQGDIESIRQAIRSPYGIILVTGPTGSGKTTTLYSALSELVNESLNIMTVEDPVEYHLGGVNQVQVNRAAGVTFAGAIRSFLRQDPDIILVGEIRDHETASAAVQASLTGHLVLATLHTNDSPTAITRLLEMGIEPFLLASSLTLVLAQRLVKLNCPDCSETVSVNSATLSMIGKDHDSFYEQTRGKGCDQCLKSGYSGRIGIFELMPVTEFLRGMMIQKSSAEQLRAHIRSTGTKSMYDQGLKLVSHGRTTLEEVLRVTRF